MTTLEKIRSLVGGKSPEEKQQEHDRSIQKEQLEIAKRISPVEAAQSMALMRNANDSGQYELGALALDPNPDIEEAKTMLRGYRIVQVEVDGEIKNEADIFGKPMLNKDGVNFFVQSLRLYSSKSFVLTSYGGKERAEQGIEMIHARCYINGVEIIKTIFQKEYEWEIDMAKIWSFFNFYTDYVESCMLRSLDSKTATNYWGSQKSIQHTTQQINDSPVKKSMFSTS